jgi:hypothetical protein
MPEKYSSFKIKSIFYGRAKVIAIISIVLIISTSYGLFFYFQDITESSVKNKLFAQQRAIDIFTFIMTPTVQLVQLL